MTFFRFLLIWLGVSASALAQADDASDGKDRFAQACLSCHGGGHQSMQSRVAPTIVAVKQHYLMQYPDRAPFVDAIVQWVKHPDQERTLMPGAINRFGLMPTQDTDDKDLELIAGYIYDTTMDKPGWFDEHFKAQHGNQKPGASE